MQNVSAHKIVSEVLYNRQHSNGLVKILYEENVSEENIKKIMGDFVIAAADTVRKYSSFDDIHTVNIINKFKFPDCLYVSLDIVSFVK